MSTKIKLNGEWIDVANNSVSDSVRNPDWSRTTQLTNAQFTSNTYRFPEDGIFINASLTKNTTQWCNCLINDLKICDAIDPMKRDMLLGLGICHEIVSLHMKEELIRTYDLFRRFVKFLIASVEIIVILDLFFR